MKLNLHTIERQAKRVLALALSTGVAACSIFGESEGTSVPKEFVTGERISILEGESGLKPDARLASVTVRLPEPQPTVDWPQPGGSETNVLHHVQGKADLKRKWKTSIGKGDSVKARITASPVVADGKIFAMDTRAQVTAIDIETGKRLWRVKLAPKGEKGITGFGGGLAYAMDRLFVSTGFGHILALEPETGERIWKRKFGIPIHAAPTVSGGRVFVSTVENQLHALSGFDGASLWSHRAISEAAGILGDTNPAVIDEIVIAPFSSGEIVALRAQNGQQAWTDSLTKAGRQAAIAKISAIAGRPAVHGGQLIAVSHSGRFVAIDVRSGERIWTRNIAGTQTPWISGEFVYVVTTESQVACLTRRDGRIKWIAQLDEYEDLSDKVRVLWTGPVMAGNQLFLFSSNGRYAALSPFTGALLETGRSGGGVNNAPVIADGVIYIVDNDGDVIALEGRSELSPTEANVQPKNVNADGVVDATRKSEGGGFLWFN